MEEPKLLTQDDLVGLTKLKQHSISEKLANTPFLLFTTPNSAKPVKHYRYIDLPPEYQQRLLKTEGFDVNEYVERPKMEKPKEAKYAFGGRYHIAPPHQQRLAAMRLAVVGLYRRRGKQKLGDFIRQIREDDAYGQLEINETKIKRWNQRVSKAKAMREDPLDHLLDFRGLHRKGATKLTEEMQAIIVRKRLHKENRANPVAVHQSLVQRFGHDAVPSVDTVRRYLEAWEKENHALAAFADNPDDAKNRYLAAQGSMSERATHANHFWELDSTPADIITTDGKRHAIMAAIDVYSRRAVFLVDERSSSYSIARLLRKAILKLGVPENVVVDNGRDYTSNHFESICLHLGIHKEVVPPYSGDCKPHVERVFRTLSHGLFEELPGYIGHSVNERQAIESRKGFQGKQEAIKKWQAQQGDKEKFAKKFLIRKENLGVTVQVGLSADDLQEMIDRWNANIYERRVHKGRDMGCTPVEKYNRSPMPPQTVLDPRVLDLLLGESETRKVGKSGIRMDGCLYGHERLAYHIGEYVFIMRPDDLGKILVYTMNMEPICVAIDPTALGQSREVLAGAKRVSKRLMREYARIVDEMTKLHDSIDPTIRHIIEDQEATMPPLAELGMSVRVPKTTVAIEAARAAIEETKQDGAQTQTEAATLNGRPVFETVGDKFRWLLETNEWTPEDERLRVKYEGIYEEVLKEHQRRKAG